LKVLIENQLINLDQGEYQTTQEGMILLESINQVNEMLYMDMTRLRQLAVEGSGM
jgi:hypothetical protein